MIKIDRNSVRPREELLRNAEGWTTHLSGLTDVRSRTRYISSHITQFLSPLRTLFNEKCAFCESRVVGETNSPAQRSVEHYHPKSLLDYYDQIFRWENLFLSCRDCNNIKGDKFPLTTDGEPIINPCDDAPDEHLTFEYLDFPGGTITTIGHLTERGKITVDLFEFNKRSDLVKRRSEAVKPLIQLSRFAIYDNEARLLLEEASSAEAEYAAFARALLKNLENNNANL